MSYTKSMPVFRYDHFKIDGFKEHPSGHLILDLKMARIGIQEYDQGGGAIRREMRTEEEVFSEDAMDSFKGVTITYLHPPEMITDKNTRAYMVGHVGDNVRRDGDWLMGLARVWDPIVKDGIRKGTIKEVSNGYYADWEEKAGDYKGKIFDGYQRNIMGNHTALGPYGWARAGRGARIMLDSKGNAYLPENKGEINDKGKSMKTLTIDGISYSYEGDDGLSQAVEKAIVARDAKVVDAENEKGEEKEKGEKSKGELDALKGENKDLKDQVSKLKDKVKGLKDPGNLKDAITARTKLLEKARVIAGKDFDHDGTDLELKITALEKSGHNLPDFAEKSDDYRDAYIDSLFDRTKPSEEKSADSLVSRLMSVRNQKSSVNDSIDRAFKDRFGKGE